MAVRTSDELGLHGVLSVEERIASRRDVGNEETRGVCSATSLKRRDRTFDRIINSHEVWTIWSGDRLWCVETEHGQLATDIFPERAFALDYANGVEIPKCDVIPVPIDDFIDDILFSEAEPLSAIRVLPVVDRTVEVMDVQDFLSFISQNWLPADKP